MVTSNTSSAILLLGCVAILVACILRQEIRDISRIMLYSSDVSPLERKAKTDDGSPTNSQHVWANNTTTTTAATTRTDAHEAHQQRRLCTRQEIRKGEWIPTTLDKPLYIPVSFKRCKGDGITAENKPWKTHIWKPTTQDCDLLDFDRTQFCQMIHNRTVAYVGDSLMTEMFHSILHLLGFDSKFVVKAHFAGNATRISVCNNSATIAYGPLDPLDDRLSAYLDSARPDYLILNRGAHYIPDDVLQQKLPSLISVLKQYKDETNPNVRIFWKTTTPGHPNCWEFHEPVHNATAMIELIKNKALYTFHPQARSFNWWEFSAQNHMVLQSFHDHKMLQLAENEDYNNTATIEVFDGWDLLLYRPDKHVGKTRKRYDCLHHCHPGPFDVFAQLLNHYLHMTPGQVMSLRS